MYRFDIRIASALTALFIFSGCLTGVVDETTLQASDDPAGEGGADDPGGDGEEGGTGVTYPEEPDPEGPEDPEDPEDPETVRVVTANVSFTISGAKVKQDFEQYSPKADVVLMQEARDVALGNLIDTSVWAVRQDTSSAAKRGSAIVVRKSIAAAGGVGQLVLRKGVDASSCPGGGINTRYIARVNVKLASGRVLHLGSAHMPPKRCWGTVYDTMADRIVSVSNDVPGRYIIGGDWNKQVATDPNNIAQRTGLKRRAPNSSIDGFFFRTDDLKLTSATRLADTNSDHRPVKVTVTIN